VQGAFQEEACFFVRHGILETGYEAQKIVFISNSSILEYISLSFHIFMYHIISSGMATEYRISCC